MLPKIVAIVGPTASGKTALSIALAKEFSGGIVNADSRQVYIGMDIGTAKAARDAGGPRGQYFSEGVEHYCLDLVEPDEEMTVALWKQAVLAAIKKISARGHTPFLVGGAWLYVSALVDNYEIPRVPPDQTQRRAMLELLEGEDGLAQLQQKLLALDPNASSSVDLRNPRRVMRALEVTLKTGKPFTEQLKKGAPLFDVLQIGIERPTHDLELRIRSRVMDMMERGLFDEVKRLNDRYGCGLPAMSGIGYTELCEVVAGRLTLEQAVEQTMLHTKQFAKKQRAWFGRDKRVRGVRGLTEARRRVREFLVGHPEPSRGIS